VDNFEERAYGLFDDTIFEAALVTHRLLLARRNNACMNCFAS
jgi:hypothetical protein